MVFPAATAKQPTAKDLGNWEKIHWAQQEAASADLVLWMHMSSHLYLFSSALSAAQSLLLLRSVLCQSGGAEVSNDSSLSTTCCAFDMPAKWTQVNSPLSVSISLIHIWVLPK